MSKNNPIENLATLTERQREILALRCEGYDYKTIGETLYIAESTVKSHMASIYIKLDLDSLTQAERNVQLYQVYCPLMKGMDLPTPPEDEPSALIQVSPALMRIVDEDEMASESAPGPAPIVIRTPPSSDQIPDRRFRFLPWLFIALLIVVVIALGTLLTVNILTREDDQSIVSENQGQDSTASDNVSEEELQEPAATVENIEEDSAAAEDSPLEQPTSIGPTKESGNTDTDLAPFAFRDDFETGPKEEWIPFLGSWIMSNGEYTITDINGWTFGITAVGDPTWGDYRISTNVNLHDDITSSRGYVIIRLQDQDNFIALQLSTSRNYTGYQHSAWFVVDDGEWREVSNTHFADELKSEMEILVEVQDDLVTTFVDGVKVTEWSKLPYASGMVGLGINSATSTDTLSFDNFVVESMGP